MREKGHKLNSLSIVSIVDKESRWFERGVREAIYELIQQPVMNKKGGLRFTLSQSWDQALATSLKHTSVNTIIANSQEITISFHNTEEVPLEKNWNNSSK